VRAFLPEGGIEIAGPGGPELLPAQAAYVLIGYQPDADFERRCGIEVEAGTLIPKHDPESCESNVPGLYVAGTLQAGRWTDRIFIENSRDHGPKIVTHLKSRLAAVPGVPAASER
jgi:thioredoxin reductase (NADPH)